MRSIAIFFFATLAATSSAEMYKCVGDSGTISYSDSPCKELPAAANKASGTFGANLLIVKSHAEIESWVKMEPARRGGNAGRLRTVARGTKVYFPAVATFPASQVGQRVSLVADMEVIGPNGKTQKIPSCCFANRVDPRAPTTIVLSPVLDLVFDTTDPNGEYRVRAMINNGAETVVAEEKFSLQ
jgi:uncharacterized protein DUF4124